MRVIDWIMIIAVVVVALVGKVVDFDGFSSDPNSPRRPRAEAFQPKVWDQETQAWMAEAPAKNGKQNTVFAQLPSTGIIEEDTENRSSVGSAFSISENGIWLTARHVVWGCDKTYIQAGSKKYLPIQKTVFHPNADAALLTTQGGPKALPLTQDLRSPKNAFGVGFPKGQPGAVHGQLIGEMTMHHRGRNGFRERVTAWSERSRIPNRKGSLGGLSGGAVLDDQGHIIGIVQAESRRRGRFMTATPETMLELLAQASTQIEPESQQQTALSLTPQFYPQSARQLITTVRVAKVICIVD